jgi:chaperonin GroES
VAVGDGKLDENGKRQPMTVAKGDRVLIGKYTGQDIKINDEEHTIVREDEILAIIEK